MTRDKLMHAFFIIAAECCHISISLLKFVSDILTKVIQCKVSSIFFKNPERNCWPDRYPAVKIMGV